MIKIMLINTVNYCKHNNLCKSYYNGSVNVNMFKRGNFTCPTYKLYNGKLIPKLGYGTWKAEKNLVKQSVKVALQEGYKHIDCASVYGNEKEVGDAISEHKEIPRENLFITSKLWNTHHNPELVATALEQTLNDLGVKYLDLYLIHWPIAFKSTPQDSKSQHQIDDIPLINTWKAMEALQQKGLIKSIGVSNFGIKDLQEILPNCTIKPAVNQIEVHPYLTQEKLLEYCKNHGIHVTAYSPLGNPGLPQHDNVVPLLENETIKSIGFKHAKTSAQILLRWGIQRGLSVIPKSTTQSRIRENNRIFDFELDEESMQKIMALNKNRRFVQPTWFTYK